MLILKAAALVIVVCVLVLCLKKDQPGFAFLLSLCGAAGLLWFAVQQLRPLLARLQQLAGQAGGDSFSILLQVLAIAFVAQLAADLCREAGPCCRRVLYGIRGPHFGYAAGIASAAKLASLVFVLFIVIAFPLSAAAAELPAGVQQILQQSELTPDKLVHITLQELLQTAGWLAEKRLGAAAATGPARGAVFAAFQLCGTAGGRWCLAGLCGPCGCARLWHHCAEQMTSLVQQVAQAANTSQLYVSGFVPVFAGVALLAGQTAGAAVYSTMFYAMAAFLAEVLQNLLLPLLQIYFCFSVSAALWGDSGIADAANLFARCFTFALKLCGMLFTFVLGLQNVLAAGTDRAALKIGKSVLSAAVPVVGDAAAAALGSASAAIGLLKGSLALAAVAALGAAVCPGAGAVRAVLAGVFRHGHSGGGTGAKAQQADLHPIWPGDAAVRGYLGTIFLSGNSIHAVAAAWREWGLTYGYAVPRGTGFAASCPPWLGWCGRSGRKMGSSPVINAVLTLYIITSVLHAVSGLNWQNFDAQLQNFASQSAPGEDYTAYGAELAMQESAAALQKLLRQSGIESVVQPQAGGVHVRLVYPADREQAETLLQNFAGDLPYTLENTQ